MSIERSIPIPMIKKLNLVAVTPRWRRIRRDQCNLTKSK